MIQYHGSCFCGHVKFVAQSKAYFPHLCSCKMCQKWSGAPTVAWVEFLIKDFTWVSPEGGPKLISSSEKTQRGFCPECGSSLCAIDEGYDKISITMSCLDDSSKIKLGKQHSFKAELPKWVPWA